MWGILQGSSSMTKVAIITGASQGIGAAMAIYFAKNGYHLALVSRDEKKLSSLQTELITQYSALVTIHPCNIADKAAVKNTFQEIIAHHKQIDVLFNNAGIYYHGTSDIPIEQFEEMIQVNLLGAFYVLHEVVPVMKTQKSGYIFNMCSRSGIFPRPILGAYGASKLSFKGYSEALYKELAPFGVKVTAFHPGGVNTQMTDWLKTPKNELVQTEDIIILVDALLRLHPYANISDIMIEARCCIGVCL